MLLKHCPLELMFGVMSVAILEVLTVFMKALLNNNNVIGWMDL
jgi:hypothetical protein